MSMNGAYGSHCQRLMQEERYQKFIRDADSPKALYEGMERKQTSFISEITRNKQTLIRSQGDYGYRNNVCTNTVATNNVAPVTQIDFNAVREEARRKTIDAQPQKNVCTGLVVSSAAIKGVCQRVQTEVDNLSQLLNNLEEVKEQVGQERIYVDNKNYEIRIDEIKEKLTKYRTIMQEFVDSATERADFVQDFQEAVELDYYRYFGKVGVYNQKKTWDRANKGWAK